MRAVHDGTVSSNTVHLYTWAFLHVGYILIGCVFYDMLQIWKWPLISTKPSSIEVLHGSHVAWQEQWKYFAYERTSFPMGKEIFCSCHATWLRCKTSIEISFHDTMHLSVSDICRLQTAGRRLRAADCKLRTIHVERRLQTTNSIQWTSKVDYKTLTEDRWVL